MAAPCSKDIPATVSPEVEMEEADCPGSPPGTQANPQVIDDSHVDDDPEVREIQPGIAGLPIAIGDDSDDQDEVYSSDESDGERIFQVREVPDHECTRNEKIAAHIGNAILALDRLLREGAFEGDAREFVIDVNRWLEKYEKRDDKGVVESTMQADLAKLMKEGHGKNGSGKSGHRKSGAQGGNLRH